MTGKYIPTQVATLKPSGIRKFINIAVRMGEINTFLKNGFVSKLFLWFPIKA